jgi:hypothetical protein
MTDMCRTNHADLNAEPWETAVAVRLPILLTGPGSSTDSWIHRMHARLALPVINVACDEGIKTTALDDAGTVILHDVEHLRPLEQKRLLRWLEKAAQRPHVISTSSRALYPLVRAGRFSEDLYYRLNSMYLDCTNLTIVELLALPDEDECIDEFPAEEQVQAPVRLPVPSGLPAIFSNLSNDQTRLALTSCAFGVLIGAFSMWVVTAQSQSAVVPVASSAVQEGQQRPASPPRQEDFRAATLQDSSARSVPSPGATAGQSGDTGTLEPAAPRPRRTVFRGALAVNSRPAGARVSINGQSLGVTPLTVRSLPAGSRVVRVTAQGYHPWASAVRVVANQRNSVLVNLQRLPD